MLLAVLQILGTSFSSMVRYDMSKHATSSAMLAMDGSSIRRRRTRRKISFCRSAHGALQVPRTSTGKADDILLPKAPIAIVVASVAGWNSCLSSPSLSAKSEFSSTTVVLTPLTVCRPQNPSTYTWHGRTCGILWGAFTTGFILQRGRRAGNRRPHPGNITLTPIYRTSLIL